MRRIARLPRPTACAPAGAPTPRTSRTATSLPRSFHASCRSRPTAPPSRLATTQDSSRASRTPLSQGRFLSGSATRRQAPPPGTTTTTTEKQPVTQQQAPDETVAMATEAQAMDVADAADMADIDIYEQLSARTPARLVVPGRIRKAPMPDQIADSTYVPAESGLELEQVGGLDDWFEDDAHWNPAVEFRGFGPRQRVTDAVVLEVLARQAVLEAVAVQQQKPDAGLAGAAVWRRGDAQTQRAALALAVDVAADGRVVGLGDNGSEAAAAIVAALLPEETEAADLAADADQPALTADEARALVAAWAEEDAAWKRISLAHDPAFKFAVTKRILQLTGHLLPDAQVAGAGTVEALLAVLVRPPKAKKLAEELDMDGTLAGLPNVSVYGRRVTPVDKHRMVGRWKVIVDELQKRELPVTGTGGYDKSVERKWAFQ